jgi:outer membrane protein TolC
MAGVGQAYADRMRAAERSLQELVAAAPNNLDARTQLSETMTRYYNALYDFKIAAAALDRAMGKPRLDIAGVK